MGGEADAEWIVGILRENGGSTINWLGIEKTPWLTTSSKQPIEISFVAQAIRSMYK